MEYHQVRTVPDLAGLSAIEWAQAAAAVIDEKLNAPEFGSSDASATQCVVAIRENIYARTDAKGLKARHFSGAFLGVLLFKQGTLARQSRCWPDYLANRSGFLSVRQARCERRRHDGPAGWVRG